MKIEMFDLPDAELRLKMQCEDCGHIQIVSGIRRDGATYFGSAYNWCDKCESGLPRAIGPVEVINEG